MEYEAVNCVDLVKTFTELKSGEIDSIISEMAYPGVMLCPNTTSFPVEGGLLGSSSFSLDVRALN